MNCKEGDLAIVVSSSPTTREFLGRIVRCLHIEGSNCFGPLWRVEGGTWSEVFGMHVSLFEDCALRPIRPQSDDAVDEMVLIAGKPNQKELTHAN